MRRRNKLCCFLVEASSAAALLLLFMGPRVSTAQASRTLSRVEADENPSVKGAKNTKSRFAFQSHGEALPFGDWLYGEGKKEREQGGKRVPAPRTVREFLHAHPARYEPDDDKIDPVPLDNFGEAGQEQQRTVARSLLSQSRTKKDKQPSLPLPHGRHARRPHPSPSSVSPYSASKRADAAGLRRFAPLAAALVPLAAALVPLLSQTAGGVEESYGPDRSRQGDEEREEDTARPPEKEGTENRDVAAAGALSSSGDCKVRIMRVTQLAVPLVVSVLLLLAILAGTSSTTSALPAALRSNERSEEREDENQRKPVRVANDADTGGAPVSGLIRRREPLADDLPRGRLERLRLISGVSEEERCIPPVDFHQRADGTLYIVIGRAWREVPGGPWADGNSYIDTSVQGHALRAYVPLRVEELLIKEGRLGELQKLLSQPPIVLSHPDGMPREDMWGSYKGTLHWGPVTHRERAVIHRHPSALRFKVHFPPELDAFLIDNAWDVVPLFRIFRAVGRLVERIHSAGPGGFKPTLLKTREDKVEL